MDTYLYLFKWKDHDDLLRCVQPPKMHACSGMKSSCETANIIDN